MGPWDACAAGRSRSSSLLCWTRRSACGRCGSGTPAMWRDARVRNAAWLRPWEPTNPETPLYRSSLGPYVAMARTMRREARQGLALPWVVTYGGQFAGQLTVGSIVWGSARSAQVGLLDRRGVRRAAASSRPRWRWPWTTASSWSGCTGSRPPSGRRTRPAGGWWRSSASARRACARRYLHIDGAWRDHLCYALTAEEVPGAAAPVAEHAVGVAVDRELSRRRFGDCYDTPCGVLVYRRAAITLRHMSTPSAGHAEGRIVEQRDTLRRHRRHLGWRAHPQVASAGFGG